MGQPDLGDLFALRFEENSADQAVPDRPRQILVDRSSWLGPTPPVEDSSRDAGRTGTWCHRQITNADG